MTLKIYINGKFLSQKITGVQRVALQYLNELEKNYSGKFEIVVVENKYKGIWSILFEQVILPFKTRGHLLINFCNISPIFKRHQITYIHDVAFIALNRHSFFFRMYYRFMMYFVTRNSLKIITVSEFSKAELLKHYNNLNDSSVVVVRNGADFTHEYTLVNSIIELKSKYKKIFLTVSSLEPRKNLSFILKAWSLKKSNNELLIIVGGKSEHFKQEDLASNIENVIFTGYVSDNELCSYYQISDYFISASEYEGFGLPVAESLNFGCTPVLSDIQVYKELFSDCSIYFDLNNIDSLRLLLEQEIVQSNSKITNYLVKNSWDESTKRLVKVIENADI